MEEIIIGFIVGGIVGHILYRFFGSKGDNHLKKNKGENNVL